MIKRLLPLLLLFASKIIAQNNLCANATPFCTGQTMQFPAGVNTGAAEVGPDYGCLGAQPNPAWFYFQIASGGPVQITMSAASDIDFIAYGPFNQVTGNCNNLTAANTVDCSFSGSNTETLTINNTLPGQVYLLMITNFSNATQQITFSQTNATTPGAGQTDCSVICTMTISATNSLCAGGSATMGVTTSTQITSVVWAGPNGFSSTTSNTIVPNVQSTGVYTAIATTTGTNPATNTCSLTHTITVTPNPSLNPTNNGPVCVGQQASFTVSGANSYTWSGPNGFSSNMSAPTIANAQINYSGSYTVMGASNSCTALATTSLQVNPNPTITASSSGNYCEGQSFTLTSGGATSYTWSGPNSFSSTQPNPTLNNAILANSGTYTLTGAMNGCMNSNTTLVTIHPRPVITAFSSGNVCTGNNFTLSATGGTVYTWTGPQGFNATGSPITVNNPGTNMTGIYTVVATGTNGCVNSSTLTQTVYPNPVPIAMGTTRCINEDLYLTASGGSTYQWSGPVNFSSSQQNPVISHGQFVNAGIYSVTITSAQNCVASATAIVVVNDRPAITWSGINEVCYGGVFTFTAHGGLTYKWIGIPGELSQASTYSVSSSSHTLLTTYTLVGADGNGCTNQTVIYPQVNALPYGRLEADNTNKCIPFSTLIYLTGNAPHTTGIDWLYPNGSVSSGPVSSTYYVGVPGIHTFTVQLTNNKGCKASFTNTVQGFPVPKADFTFSPENLHENEYLANFYDQSSNANISTWNWDFYSNNQYISNKQNPVYEFPQIGNYFVSLKVTSDHGCVDSITKKLTVSEDATFYIPNAFTPNGDGNNDVFTPKTVGVKKYKMEIFDRWGELIFISTDITLGWDGKHKKGGEILPQGVYVYKISALLGDRSKSKQYTGHVSLLK
jgi:gliding motility-associated-like protein